MSRIFHVETFHANNVNSAVAIGELDCKVTDWLVDIQSEKKDFNIIDVEYSHSGNVASAFITYTTRGY